MKFKLDYKSIEWWYWVVTLVGFIVGLSGVREGFYLAIIVSAVQIGHFVVKKGVTAFPTQVRHVYFLFTPIGLVDPTLIWYGLMTVSTMMVILFDRCVLARILILMPWNKGVKLS